MSTFKTGGSFNTTMEMLSSQSLKAIYKLKWNLMKRSWTVHHYVWIVWLHWVHLYLNMALKFAVSIVVLS